MRPAMSHPPPSPRASSTSIITMAAGMNARIRSERFGTNLSAMIATSGTYRSRYTATAASSPMPDTTTTPA